MKRYGQLTVFEDLLSMGMNGMSEMVLFGQGEEEEDSITQKW